MKPALIMTLMTLMFYVSAQENVRVIEKFDTAYTENFDALGTGSVNMDVLTGWYVTNNDTPVTEIIANNGNILEVGPYNYGSSGSTDRALGNRSTLLSKGGLTWVFKNTTGKSIRKFGLYYTGEQWYGGLSEGQTFEFEIGTGTSINNLSYSSADLDFNNPQECNKVTVLLVTSCSTAKGALNGNLTANRTKLDMQFDLGNDSILNGEYISFRWTDDNAKLFLQSHAMALDDLGFVAYNDTASNWYSISNNLTNTTNWTRFPNEVPSELTPVANLPNGFDDDNANFFITKNLAYVGDFSLRGNDAKLIVNQGVTLTLGNLSTSNFNATVVLNKNTTLLSQMYQGSGSVTLNIDTCMEGSNVIFDSNSPNIGTLNIPTASYYNLEIRDSHGGASKTYSMLTEGEIRNKFLYSASNNVMGTEALKLNFTADSIPFEMPNYSGELAFSTFKIADGSTLHLNDLKFSSIDAEALELNADFTMGTGSMLSLDSIQTLIINSGSFTHNGILEVKNNASLIINEGVTVSGIGITTIERVPEITGVNVTNHWSSPTNNATVGLGGTISGNRHWVYRNGEDDNEDYVVLSQVFPIGTGRGYTVKGVRPVTFVANTPEELNIGDITYNAVAEHDSDADSNEYYLLGNPYASGLSVSAFLQENSESTGEVLGSVYLFSQVNTFGEYSRVADNIAVNLLGSTDPGLIIPASVQEVSGFGDVSIASGQGFFVIDKTPDDDNIQINYKSAMQLGINNDFKRVKSNIQSRFWLMVNDGEKYKTTLIGFADDATFGADNSYDAPLAITEKTLNIWSNIGAKRFEIQALPPTNVASYRVPLGLYLAKAGNHEISVVKASSETSSEIILLDTETGVFFDLRKGAYNFYSSKKGEVANRFFLFMRGEGQPVGVDDLNAELEKECSIFYKANSFLKSNLNLDNNKIENVAAFTLDGKNVSQLFFNTQSNSLLSNAKINVPIIIKYTLPKNNMLCTQKIF